MRETLTVSAGEARPSRNAGLPAFALPRAAIVGLILFGAAGLILAGFLLVGLVRLAGGANGLAHEQQALVQLTQSGRTTAVDGRAAAQRAEAGVTSTASAAEQAANFVGDLGAALRETAAALRVDVFGTRPFESSADRVDQAAAEADQTVAGLQAAASQARAGAAQLHSVATDLDRITANLTTLEDGLAGSASQGGLDAASFVPLELALVGLVVWLAVPAAGCLYFGIRSLRRPSPNRRSASNRHAPAR